MGRGPGYRLSTLTNFVMSYHGLFVANVEMKRKDHEYNASYMHHERQQTKKLVAMTTAVAKQEKLSDKSLMSDKAFAEWMNI